MRTNFIVAAAIAAAISTVGSRSTEARREPAVQKAMPRASGVLMIDGIPHPYLAEGSGVTCVMVGLAPSYPPLFSDRLKERIRFVYVDFKKSWNAESPRGVERITLDGLVDEVDQVRRGLGLDKVCVVGHSAPGLVAVEYALRHPGLVSHMILVSVEPCFTADYLRARTRFWEDDASADRKATLERNITRFPDDLLRRLSPRDVFALRYVRNGRATFTIRPTTFTGPSPGSISRPS
jgi:pimeloyl-ACP methyl ester carboxylesterase